MDGSPLDIVATVLALPRLVREFQQDPWKHVEWVRAELLPVVGRRKLATFVDLGCEGPEFDPEPAARFLESARDRGFSLKLHADQFARTGAVDLAVRLGAVSVDHLERTELQDVVLLAGARTIATLLPGSAFHSREAHYAPARLLIDTGAAVALGTNFNPWTCPTYSMQMVIALACNQMSMTPAEAISAATINAAHAIGRAGQIGSLEPGKSADLVVLNASDYREIPYHFGVNHVAMTIKKGVLIYEEGPVASDGGSVW